MSISKYIERKRLEKEREIRRKLRKDRLSTVAKVMSGSVLGAGLGILFAPKSGKETREDIKNATIDGVNYISENATNLAHTVREKSSELKELVTDKYEEFRDRNMTEILPDVIEDFEEELKGEVSK